MSDKKKMQLGMNHGTARHRLIKDLLWKFIVDSGQDKCCKCGKTMTKDSFSIEHIKPWLDSEDPVGLFFDIENISFSHLSCNISEGRRTRKYATDAEREQAEREYLRDYKRRTYTPESRRERYIRTGQ